MGLYAERMEAARAEGRKFMTAPEVGRLFGVRPETVKAWCRDGKLPGSAKTPGGHWRIPVTSVEHYAGRLDQIERDKNVRHYE